MVRKTEPDPAPPVDEKVAAILEDAEKTKRNWEHARIQWRAYQFIAHHEMHRAEDLTAELARSDQDIRDLKEQIRDLTLERDALLYPHHWPSPSNTDDASVCMFCHAVFKADKGTPCREKVIRHRLDVVWEEWRLSDEVREQREAALKEATDG